MNLTETTKNRIIRLLIAFGVFWLPIIVFLKLAGEVIEKEPLGPDTAILTFIHERATPLLDQFFLFITNFGGVIGVIVLVALLSAYLVKKRAYTKLFIVIGSVGGAALANVILKGLFQRDRPSLWHQYIVESGFSFPSGHSMATAALSASLIVICWNTRYRWLAVVIGILYTAVIGLSRMYLGVHYPSDVIAGWSVSIAWVAVVTYFVVRFKRRE